MIPLRLSVKNFMCYRDGLPALDLEGVHVACLSGDNGTGKTALLDAMTWALWGSARARTQEELVHQGQRDMAVELDFLARGQRYRVSRRHSRAARSRQGATILELQAASGDGFRPITANTVRETEGRIREILHMDYETFVNTAFLRQGDADRFTTSPASKRKETLAEVLGLSYYQGLEEKARAQSRALKGQVQGLESVMGLRQEEIARRPQYQEQLAGVKADLARMEPEAEAQRLRVEELRRDVDALQGRHQEAEELAHRLAEAQKEIAHFQRQVQAHQARVVDYQAALEREEEIRTGFARLQESRAELEYLNQALARKGEMDREVATLEREVAVQRERLSGQAQQLRKRVAQDLEPKTKRLPQIEEGLRALAQERARLAELEEAVDQHRQEAQEVAARVRSLEESNAALLNDMEQTRKKFDMLKRGDDLCPLCRQPLGADGQEHLRREYEAQGGRSKEQFQHNSSEQRSLERTHKELTARLAQTEADFSRRRQRAEGTAAGLERDKAESEAAGAELKAASAELQQVTGVLESEGFAAQSRQRLAQLEKEASALGYDEEKRRRAAEQVKDLAGYDELHRKLQEAAQNLPPEREALRTASQMLEGREKQAQAAQQRKAAIEGEIKALPSLQSRLEEAQSGHQELVRLRDEARVREGVLKQQLERCDALEGELRQQRQESQRLLEEKGVYDELAVAFGKNGIQALIIETAIPQLEADANDLLGRLTDNRMFLRLQLTQGRMDGRTGLPSEELDIKVADEVGTRSYETFSGGEAFRIDFALRIALSKLLARRSGAPLPILFIDEGFGSQDVSGQERLIEAIQSIQDDFEKIIVITHVEQIKEAFPVRIEVTKTGEGSVFRME